MSPAFPQVTHTLQGNALANTGRAMVVAQEELNIPRLFEPKALADGKLDDKSIKTYVSFFPMAAKEAGVGRSLSTPRSKPKSAQNIKIETLNPRIRNLRRRMQAVTNAKKNNPAKRKDDDLPKDIDYGKKQLGKCEAELDKLLKERDAMKKEIEALNQKLKDANAEKEALQKTLSNASGAQKLAAYVSVARAVCRWCADRACAVSSTRRSRSSSASWPSGRRAPRRRRRRRRTCARRSRS